MSAPVADFVVGGKSYDVKVGPEPPDWGWFCWAVGRDLDVEPSKPGRFSGLHLVQFEGGEGLLACTFQIPEDAMVFPLRGVSRGSFIARLKACAICMYEADRHAREDLLQDIDPVTQLFDPAWGGFRA